MIEWLETLNVATFQQTICLFVDGDKRKQVQYTFGPSDYEHIDEIVNAAMADTKYVYKDLSRVQLIIAKFSLHKLLHKLKEQNEQFYSGIR